MWGDVKSARTESIYGLLFGPQFHSCCNMPNWLLLSQPQLVKCDSRPAVILSYFISSLAAMLSALSYVEFAVDMPIAGGAFNYINSVFGEFIAW